MTIGRWGFWDELLGLSPTELITTARRREAELNLEPSTSDHRSTINMLRHDYTYYDHRKGITGRVYDEILDEISRDFPWLAAQCERDKETHVDRSPEWVQEKRFSVQAGVERQRLGREAAKKLWVGAKVTWRGQEAEITEIRRSRIRARLSVNGATIDRPADEVSL